MQNDRSAPLTQPCKHCRENLGDDKFYRLVKYRYKVCRKKLESHFCGKLFCERKTPPHFEEGHNEEDVSDWKYESIVRKLPFILGHSFDEAKFPRRERKVNSARKFLWEKDASFFQKMTQRRDVAEREDKSIAKRNLDCTTLVWSRAYLTKLKFEKSFDSRRPGTTNVFERERKKTYLISWTVWNWKWSRSNTEINFSDHYLFLLEKRWKKRRKFLSPINDLYFDSNLF